MVYGWHASKPKHTVFDWEISIYRHIVLMSESVKVRACVYTHLSSHHKQTINNSEHHRQHHQYNTNSSHEHFHANFSSLSTWAHRLFIYTSCRSIKIDAVDIFDWIRTFQRHANTTRKIFRAKWNSARKIATSEKKNDGREREKKMNRQIGVEFAKRMWECGGCARDGEGNRYLDLSKKYTVFTRNKISTKKKTNRGIPVSMNLCSLHQ